MIRLKDGEVAGPNNLYVVGSGQGAYSTLAEG